MKYGIIDLSGDSRITKDGLLQIAAALTKQSAVYAGWWESVPSEVGVFDSEGELPADFSPFRLLKTLDTPDALAYHTVDENGRPQLVCGTDVIFNNGGTLLTGSTSISAALSHERNEADADPYVDTWVDMLDGVNEIALENSDPCEGDSYEIDGVSVSNFVGPRWFRKGNGPFDFMGKISAPFTMGPGGYIVTRAGGPQGTINQTFGDEMPEWKRLHKLAHSRRVRRHREKHGI